MSEIRLKKIKDIFPDYINGYAFKSINLSNKQEKGYLPLLKIANVGKNGKTDFYAVHGGAINVTKEKIIANLRGFDSVFDYLLFSQKVTREMYNRQIDLITKKVLNLCNVYHNKSIFNKIFTLSLTES